MAEQLLLDVLAGPLKGQTFAVPANSNFEIGRLPECSLSIPDDLTVSRHHFRIEFHPPDCRLVHISQTAPTNLNDVSVVESKLNDGDEISFGLGNRLKLRFVHRTSRANLATLNFDAPVIKALPSGWDECHGTSESPDIEQILTIVDCHGNFGAVVDFPLLQISPPDTLGEPVPLFGWLTPDLAVKHSPSLFWSANSPQLLEFVEENWGKDAIVCFGSELSNEEILDHWRAAIGAPDNQAGNAMTAYFRPSLLNLILTHQSSPSVRFLISKFKWLLIESTETSSGWKLFCNEEFKKVIQGAGFR